MRVPPEPWGGSDPEVTGPAEEPGIEEGSHVGDVLACCGRGHLHRPLCGIGSMRCGNQAPRKGRQASRLLSTVPRGSLASLPHIWPGQPGFRVERSAVLLRGSLSHPSTQNTEALASWLQWPRFSFGESCLLRWRSSRAFRSGPTLHPCLALQGGPQGHSAGPC